MAELQVTKEIDARGAFCPGPMMELIRVLRSAPVGTIISVLSTDSGSKRDIPKWVEKARHELMSIENFDGYDRITVRKLH